MKINKKELPACPVETTLLLISNKWKILIIRDLSDGTKRFGELKKSINNISQKVLTSNLREMEENENVSSIDEGVFQEVLKSEKLEEIQEIYNDIEKNVFIEKLPEEEKKYILVNLLLIKENE